MERINSQTILAKRRSKQRKQKLVRGLAIVLALSGDMEFLEVQLEGKKRMDAGSFLRGVKIEKGDCLC